MLLSARGLRVSMIDLGTLGGATSAGHGINNLGVVVGYSYNSAGDFLGFTYQNGTMTALGTLGGSWSIAYAINDQNQIAGQAYTRNNLAAHAFGLTGSLMADLGTLGGSTSWGVLALTTVALSLVTRPPAVTFTMPLSPPTAPR